ncbi:MAG: SpoVG family protein [Planctomycetota bacterium]
MEITEVRVKLVPPGQDKLRAFCSITIDQQFVIRDLKVIEGAKGAFVAMPSRKLTTRCSRCGGKNNQGVSYCNHCGARVSSRHSQEGRAKLHADIAHPINTECRQGIQAVVLETYLRELERSQDPRYEPPELDDFDRDMLGDYRRDSSGRSLGRNRIREQIDAEAVSAAEEVDDADETGEENEPTPPNRIRDVRPRSWASGSGPVESSGTGDPEAGHPEAQEADELAPGENSADFEPEQGPGASRLPREAPPEEDPEPEDNFGAGLFS